jgi:hypothetical protein
MKINKSGSYLCGAIFLATLFCLPLTSCDNDTTDSSTDDKKTKFEGMWVRGNERIEFKENSWAYFIVDKYHSAGVFSFTENQLYLDITQYYDYESGEWKRSPRGSEIGDYTLVGNGLKLSSFPLLILYVLDLNPATFWQWNINGTYSKQP